MPPAISVILPAYNCEKYISQAIQSILDQSFKDFELIVVNDGSRDSTLKIANSFSDSRVRVIDHNTNRGLVHSLNEALDSQKGKYIARMDADDVAHPSRLAKQFEFLEKNTDIGICGTAFSYLDENLKHTMPEGHDEIKLALLFYNPFCHPSVMIRSDVLSTHRLRYDQAFHLAEDYEMWTRVLEKTKGANLSESLLEYRVHPHQVSSQVSKQDLVADRIRIAQVKKLIPNVTEAQLQLHLALIRKKKMTLHEALRAHRWTKKLSRELVLKKYAPAAEISKFFRYNHAMKLYQTKHRKVLNSFYHLMTGFYSRGDR